MRIASGTLAGSFITRLNLAAIFALVLGSVALSAEDNKNSAFEFALIGDAPYNPVVTAGAASTQQYPSPPYERLIANINTYRQLEFVAHIGDIKAGNTLCENNVYTQNLTYFNSFRHPVLYTPGDNEWTDCHRANNGAFDPMERLSLIRTMYFATNRSLGQRTFSVTRQAGFPENARWQIGRVIFVTVHMPGSNNNQGRTAAMDAEYAARNAANLQWINEAFNLAQSDPKNVGVMFFFQANPFERFVEAGQGYAVSGFSGFISTIRARTLAYNKPVAVAHGDTHYMRVDHPLTGAYPACTGGLQGPVPPCVPLAVPGSPTDRVNNFTRVEVFAQNDVHWIKVGVDPKDANVFSFMPMRVAGN
jgi:hypothetical protein